MICLPRTMAHHETSYVHRIHEFQVDKYVATAAGSRTPNISSMFGRSLTMAGMALIVRRSAESIREEVCGHGNDLTSIGTTIWAILEECGQPLGMTQPITQLGVRPILCGCSTPASTNCVFLLLQSVWSAKSAQVNDAIPNHHALECPNSHVLPLGCLPCTTSWVIAVHWALCFQPTNAAAVKLEGTSKEYFGPLPILSSRDSCTITVPLLLNCAPFCHSAWCLYGLQG